MTITQLYIFLKVAELKNFTKASEVLHVSQPAVSHAISGLEKTLGASLFIRDRKNGLMITEIGEKVIPYAQELINQYKLIENEVKLYNENKEDVIHIGGFPSITSMYMPRMISFFRDHYPGIKLSFIEGSVNDLKEKVAEGVIDFGITVLTKEDSNSIFLFNEPMVVILFEGHPYYKKNKILLADLEGQDIILCGSGFEKSTIETFEENNLRFNVSHIVDSVNTALSLTKEKLGITILSSKSFEYLPDSLRAVSFTPEVYRKVGIIHEESRRFRKSVQICIDKIKEFEFD